MSVEKTKLTMFFLDYINAFNHFDLTALQTCYQLPCSLHTPDKLSMLLNDDDFIEEFTQIFTVLKQAKVEQLIATKASFSPLNISTLAVCIDWAFIDNNGQVFADFTAFYHIAVFDSQFKIMNVVSHELDNAVNLTYSLDALIKY